MMSDGLHPLFGINIILNSAIQPKKNSWLKYKDMLEQLTSCRFRSSETEFCSLLFFCRWHKQKSNVHQGHDLLPHTEFFCV